MVIDEIGAENPLAIEDAGAVPFGHASASKPSVMVNRGISQPMLAFSRLMSRYDARETDLRLSWQSVRPLDPDVRRQLSALL